jgi:rhodanese-related sulfurtransferase
MQRVFFFFALTLLILAVILLVKASAKQDSSVAAENFLNEIQSSNRYLSTDEVAKRIIDGDPTYFLVDVRSQEEFNLYTLPGAVNIPLANVLDKQWNEKLNQVGLNIIFFSNDEIDAEQAWALCKLQGYANLYVLDGGLTRWVETIMLPPKPDELATSVEMDLYTFRTGASIYFGSGTITIPVIVEVETTKEEANPAAKKSIQVDKKVKAEAEGGC